MAFWLFSLKFVRDNVMRFFREFHEHGHARSINVTFVVLIQKKKVDLREFRPISLIGVL